MDKKKIKGLIKEFGLLTVGTAIIACAVFFFLMPSHLSVSSISGLAVVLNHFLPLPVSVISMILNVVLLIIGWLLVGKEFGGKTAYTSILLPVMVGILERKFPENQSLTGDAFLDMLGYVFVVSIGLALLFNANASSGGLDIVAKLLNKFFRMELGKAMSAAGMCVALSSALAYDTKTVFLSILGTYLNGIVLDNFIFGIDRKRRVCILSPKLEEIREFILHELHSGATIYESYGAYEMKPRREIITVYNVGEISYQPKPR